MYDSYKDMFNVGAEERDIVSGGHHHSYVGMDGVEGGVVVAWMSTPKTIVI